MSGERRMSWLRPSAAVVSATSGMVSGPAVAAAPIGSNSGSSGGDDAASHQSTQSNSDLAANDNQGMTMTR